MSLTFYSAPMSSATPVELALNELAVPHEKVTFDLAARPQKRPEYLKLNPNGKVPTLVVDGTPMFEGFAIILYLGDRYGVQQNLWPAANTPERMAALSWSAWGYVTFVSAIQRLNMAQSPRVDRALHNAAQAKLATQDLQDLLGILDARLVDRAYLLGQNFSLADLIVASIAQYGTACGAKVDAHSHVRDWLARCAERPSFKAT